MQINEKYVYETRNLSGLQTFVNFENQWLPMYNTTFNGNSLPPLN